MEMACWNDMKNRTLFIYNYPINTATYRVQAITLIKKYKNGLAGDTTKL
jgi:hypothetical protein